MKEEIINNFEQIKKSVARIKELAEQFNPKTHDAKIVTQAITNMCQEFAWAIEDAEWAVIELDCG